MWGDPGVTMRRTLASAVAQWATGGQPQTIDIARVGILRRLRMITNAAVTVTAGTGTAAADVTGPWSAYTQLAVIPNQGAPILRLSGLGAFIADAVSRVGEDGYTLDTNVVAETNAEAAADRYSFPTVTGTFLTPMELRMSQFIKSLGTEIGLWPLENPTISMQLSFTPNSPTAVSPFSVASLTAAQEPYLVTGNATVTLTTPAVTAVRELYEVPENPQDDPPYTYVVRWLENQPQIGGVSGATFTEWKATPLSGALLRVYCQILDGAQGIAASKLTASNALNMLFGADTSKTAETANAALQRQWDLLGYNLPQGVYGWDFLGRDLTMADTIDLYSVPEVRFDINSTALAANAVTKFWQQIVTPVVLQARN